jgi:molecular chaperone IbpA
MLTTSLTPINAIRRHSIGLDEWFDRVNSTFDSHSNYPPHNLVKEDSTHFRLELALAGYSKQDVEVSTEWNKLFIEAKKLEEDTQEYIHRGLARRSFNKTFLLSDDVEVSDVKFSDGLLTIHLVRVIPEHQKKKTYEIA